MKFLRGALVFVVASVFTPLLFLTVVTAALAITFTPVHIKTWLKNSNVYAKLDNAVLQSVSSSSQDDGNVGNLLNQPEAQAAAKSAFTPQLLQQSTETFIDGTFNWLDGKTSSPTFRIDLSGAKQHFATGIGSYALNRYNALPVCAKGQFPDTTDVLSINCRVPGFDITSAINQEVQSVATSKDFLANPVITGSSLTVHNNASSNPPASNQAVPIAQKYPNLPKEYKWLKLSPYIFGALSLICAVIIIFVSLERRKGMRRVAMSLISTAVFLFVGAWLIDFGLKKVSFEFNQNNAVSTLAQSTLLSITHDIGRMYEKIDIYFGVAFVVIAIIILIGLLITRKRNKPVKQASQKSPENTDDNPPAEAPSEQPAEPPATPRPRPRPLIQ